MTTLEFDRLVRQYQGLVYTVCHQLVPDVGEAQDLTQKTVEAQVYRAKKMLAAQLRASGAEAPQKPERRNQNG